MSLGLAVFSVGGGRKSFTLLHFYANKPRYFVTFLLSFSFSSRFLLSQLLSGMVLSIYLLSIFLPLDFLP